jgi:hypothetical protein
MNRVVMGLIPLSLRLIRTTDDTVTGALVTGLTDAVTGAIVAGVVVDAVVSWAHAPEVEPATMANPIPAVTRLRHQRVAHRDE